MAVTNEFERDTVNQAHLKHPGRIDMVVFQNIPDAGDGFPGIQRCFRNYLHEGGMEKDLQLVGHGILGTSVDISNVELQQLSNIGSATISGTQWGYVGALNQGLTQTSNVNFGQITMSGNIVMGSDDITFTSGGLVDGVDVGSHDHSGSTNGENVPFTSLSGDIVYTQLDSVVDVSGTGGSTLISRADHLHTDLDGSSKVDHVNLNNKGSNTHIQIDSHISAGNPHGITLDKAFDVGKIINGANSQANGFRVGDADDYFGIYASSDVPTIESVGAQGKIINIANPTNNQDVATKNYTDNVILEGDTSTDLVHSNDIERTKVTDAETGYFNLKTIRIYKNIKACKVVFDYKHSSGSSGTRMRLKRNTTVVGGPFECTDTYQTATVNDVELKVGDELIIEGNVWSVLLQTVYARNQRISYRLFFSADI